MTAAAFLSPPVTISRLRTIGPPSPFGGLRDAAFEVRGSDGRKARHRRRGPREHHRPAAEGGPAPASHVQRDRHLSPFTGGSTSRAR